MIQAQSAPVAAPIRYDLRAMTPALLEPVRRWLALAHVTRWWPVECALRAINRHLGEPAIACLILAMNGMNGMNGRDMGYSQVYDPHRADGDAACHPYREEPRGARGIDLFIGEASHIGQGHGPRFIGRVLDHLFDAGAPCVLSDPSPLNVRSVAALRSAGFRSIGERDTGGHVLLMRCDSPRQRISP